MSRPKSAVPSRRMTRRTRSALYAKAPPTARRDPVPLTLFDAPAVTDDDVAAWVAAVCPHLGLEPGSRRYLHYVENWRIAEKVAQAKADGRFWQTVSKGRHFRDSAMMYGSNQKGPTA